METHAPVTLEETFVGALERQFDCAPKGEAVIPPPANCPQSVHSMYALGQAHVFTILVVVIFAIALFQMIMIAINPNADH